MCPLHPLRGTTAARMVPSAHTTPPPAAIAARTHRLPDAKHPMQHRRPPPQPPRTAPVAPSRTTAYWLTAPTGASIYCILYRRIDYRYDRS